MSKCICNPCTHGLEDYCNGGAEDEANAHLIAAAPEMYRFIEYLYGELSGVEETIDWSEAKELLAKARGE